MSTRTRNKRTSTPRHVIVKFQNNEEKEKLLKILKRKKKKKNLVTYKGTEIRKKKIDCSLVTLEARGQWKNLQKSEGKGFPTSNPTHSSTVNQV